MLFILLFSLRCAGYLIIIFLYDNAVRCEDVQAAGAYKKALSCSYYNSINLYVNKNLIIFLLLVSYIHFRGLFIMKRLNAFNSLKSVFSTYQKNGAYLLILSENRLPHKKAFLYLVQITLPPVMWFPA